MTTGFMMDGDGRTQLRSLKAQATLKYSVKDYNAAADLYSQATELQAEINGELSSENADLLYAYGRCLYHVAVMNSDVLGSKVASEKRDEGQKASGSKKQKRREKVDEDDGQKKIAEEVVTKVIESKDGPIHPNAEADGGSGQYFQFKGDENFDTSDEDEEEEGPEAIAEDAEKADEEDDFVNAYEVLDLARVLLVRKIEECENSSGKGEERCDSQQLQQLKERLADTYDLQAEISLEGERFPNAVLDLRSALELKKELFLQESSLIAEAHFKLSLALEFSSVTQQKIENGDSDSKNGIHGAHVDESMRTEAALEMEAAIASCRIRIKKEEAILANPSEATQKSKATEGDVAEVKDMVKEMEQRVSNAFSIKDYTLTSYLAPRTPPTPSIYQ